jgi:hypothetical protein
MSTNNENNSDLPYADENVGNIEEEFEIEGEVPELSDEQKKQFQSRYGKRSGWQKVKDFGSNLIQGENSIGKYLGLGLDVGESFLPKYVSRIRDVFQSKLKKRTMLNGKKWYKSKTIWSAILIVVIAVLQAVGVNLMANPELTSTVFEVAMLLAGAFGLYGLRDAIDKQADKYKSN